MSETDIQPFQAIAISRLAHRMKADGRSIIHMEFGQPSTGAPKAAIEAAHRVLDSDAMGYWESAALKARIAQRYQDEYGVAVDPERILLTCGASPGWSWRCPRCSRPAIVSLSRGRATSPIATRCARSISRP